MTAPASAPACAPTRRAPRPRPRADALRNRERIVTAAREMFVEYGSEAPLDEIARRAGIGNATLYRHFPDRYALVHDVVLSVMARVADCAERIAVEESAAEHPDPFAALCRFVHIAADERIGALCPMLSDAFDRDCPDLDAQRERLEGLVEGLMERARAAGRLRGDVAAGDLMMVLSQLTRQLPDTGCLNLDRFTHRHLQLFLDGLAAPARSVLPGSAATLEELRRAAP
ncbi:TetR/AcrR family transcriptional regulator [Streptomyces corynorhini]|uniref:TetR/AcrR family transcriptional regulator n=1 Tax=Streptomyces corynorhini TaxID=2282652 RepID=UPI001F31DB4C|nr:TetR/AcrR family transcriptional regulator [Streptomyces corynorhini]